MNKNVLTMSTSEYRPCLVEIEGNYNKAFFHRWDEQATIGICGPIKRTKGIVELEDGSILNVLPTQIRFIDDPGFDEYAFDEVLDEVLKEAKAKSARGEVCLD